MKIQISFSKVTRKELSDIERDSTIRCGVEYEFKLDELRKGIPDGESPFGIQEYIDGYKEDLIAYSEDIIQLREDWFKEYKEAVKYALTALKEWIESGPEYDDDMNLSDNDRESFNDQLKEAYVNIKRFSNFTDADDFIKKLNGQTTYKDFTGIHLSDFVSDLPEEVDEAHTKIEELEELEYPDFPIPSAELNDYLGFNADIKLKNIFTTSYPISEQDSSSLRVSIVSEFESMLENRPPDQEDETDLLEFLQNKDWSNFPVDDHLIGSYHDFPSDTKNWRIETDRSLEGEGVEIISPPLDLEDTFETMEQMFDAIKEEGYTDKDCGLHINLSIPNMANMNLAKLLLFVDEGYVDKFFGNRRVTGYVEFVERKIENLKTRIKFKDMKKYQQIEDELISSYDVGKYGAINISGFNAASKSGSNRIEFRYIGGSNYENKFNYIKTQILKYAYYIKVACDPSYKRTEYLKKLMRLRVKHGGPVFDPKVAEKIKETSTFIFYRVGKKIIRVPKDGSAST